MFRFIEAKVISDNKREWIIRLRLEERKTLQEISLITNTSIYKLRKILDIYSGITTVAKIGGHKCPKTIEGRFWRHVKRGDKDECWEWSGSRTPHGYGRLSVNGNLEYAHRLSWTFVNGSIPEETHILHKCDNPPCVNPNHLYAGTHQDNMKDRNVRGRVGKLSHDEVREIREKYKPSIYGYVKLGREYNVSTSTIRNIIIGVTYKYVD